MKKALKNKDKNLKLTTLGFTLIELLAVIVILAIIAVIATPIIVGLIEDARRSSNEVGVTNYIDALEQQIAIKNLKEGFSPSECELKVDTLVCDNEEVKMSVSGETPTSGYVSIDNGIVKGYNFKINGTTVTNETPLECFTLENITINEQSVYAITDYSDSCPKEIIIPKFNGEPEYYDMYEITEIPSEFNMDVCKEEYLNDNAEATEEDAKDYCMENQAYTNMMSNYYLVILNYSEESRDYLLNKVEFNELTYSENKVLKKRIKDYNYNFDKCVSYTKDFSDDAVPMCREIESLLDEYLTLEQLETGMTSMDELVMYGILFSDIEYSYVNEIAKVSENAFKDKGLVSVDITNSIQEIGNKAYCGNLLNVNSVGYIKINEINPAALCNYVSTDISCFTYQEIEGGIEITDYSDSCSRDVVIPTQINGKDVISIGSYAFSAMDKDTGYINNQLTSVIFPTTIVNIGSYAFRYNSLSGELDLSELTNLTTLGFRSFLVNDLTSTIVPSTVTDFEACEVFYLNGDSEGNFTYTYNGVTENMSCPG